MPYCPSCGETLTDEARFCSNCGSNLASDEGDSRFDEDTTHGFRFARGATIWFFWLAVAFVILVIIVAVSS